MLYEKEIGFGVKKVVIGIVIAVAVALVVVFVPLIEVPYLVTVQYQDTETYFEDEPYEVTETYSEAVPLDYEVVTSEGHGEGITSVLSVELRNLDDIAGTFTVDFSIIYGCTFISPGSIKVTSMFASDQKELQLAPNAKGTATSSIDNEYPANCDVDSWSYDVTPSTKEVEEERTVTEYRQVQKERIVTKEREETHYKKVPVLEYLRSRF
jgi:hypothetical protein